MFSFFSILLEVTDEILPIFGARKNPQLFPCEGEAFNSWSRRRKVSFKGLTFRASSKDLSRVIPYIIISSQTQMDLKMDLKIGYLEYKIYNPWVITITGWWLSHPSEKYEFVSWDDDIANIWTKMFQTTKQLLVSIIVKGIPKLRSIYFYKNLLMQTNIESTISFH